MAEIIPLKQWDEIKIKKNEWVSYAILRKMLKDWENLTKKEVEKEFSNLNKENRTKLKNLSFEIEKQLKKPILEGKTYIISEENSKKLDLKISENKYSKKIEKTKSQTSNLPDLQTELLAKRKEVSDNSQNLKNLEKKLQEQKSILNKQDLEIKELEAKLANLKENEVLDLQEILIQKRQEVAKKMQEVQELQEKMKQAEKIFTEKNTKIAELEKRLKELNNKN